MANILDINSTIIAIANDLDKQADNTAFDYPAFSPKERELVITILRTLSISLIRASTNLLQKEIDNP